MGNWSYHPDENVECVAPFFVLRGALARLYPNDKPASSLLRLTMQTSALSKHETASTMKADRSTVISLSALLGY